MSVGSRYTEQLWEDRAAQPIVWGHQIRGGFPLGILSDLQNNSGLIFAETPPVVTEMLLHRRWWFFVREKKSEPRLDPGGSVGVSWTETPGVLVKCCFWNCL